MAVVFDAQCTSDVTGSAATSFSDATQLTIGSGANRALVVMVVWSTATPPTGVTFTWNGLALTLISATSVGTTDTSANVALYGMLNPASGTKTLTGLWTGARDFYVGSVAYSGVDQTSIAVAFPHGNTATGNSGSPTVAITSAVGNAVVGVMGTFGGFISGTGTSVFIDTLQTMSGFGQRYAGASTVNNAFTTGSSPWAICGCDVLAAAGGSVPGVMWYPGWSSSRQTITVIGAG